MVRIFRSKNEMTSRFPQLPPRLGAAICMASLAIAAGCHRGLPSPSSAEYHEFISSFYVGLAALQVGDDVRAASSLSHAVQLAPGEPAAWTDWGILALRQRNFNLAAERFGHARKLVPKDDRIYYLLGILGSDRGDPASAIKNLREAVRLNPSNIPAEYQLALEIERQGGTGSEDEFQQLIAQIVAAQPRNLPALLELSRIAAKRGDTATLRSVVERIAAQSTAWPQDARDQLAQLQSAANSGPTATAAIRSVFLRNVLMQLPAFRQELAQIKPAPGDEAQPFTHLLRVESPPGRPAPPDTALSFSNQPLANPTGEKWDWIGAVSLNGEGAPAIVTANSHEVRLSTGAAFPFPGGTSNAALSPESVLPIDFDYDFKTDLVLAGAGGLRFMRQNNPATFTDVTTHTKLPKDVLSAAYTGAWAVDIEADGDLDIVLGTASGLPTVLRNNGDGTFKPIHPFAGISGIRQFVWADLNGDGNPDAALIDGAGRLHVFINQRLGNFAESALPTGFNDVKAIVAADADHDGVLDLLAVQAGGSIVRLSNINGAWDTGEIAQVPDAAHNLAGDVRLRVADLDNNGAFDLVLANVGTPRSAGAIIWLADENQHFIFPSSPQGPARVFDAARVSSEGHLDLLGLTTDGQPIDAVNHTTKNYHWQVIRPRAHQATGDQRINSFGIGGQIEIRSGLLVQMQPINSPQLHFGLGNETGAEVARLVWPNGTVRAEFALKADQEILTEQRLKGSCPFLFAWNGSSMQFVKDTVPWGAALGLRIDSMGPARIAATEEWYKIPGSALAPRDGSLDLSITGELWETYYYDYLGLMAVDHPAGTEIFTDERFVVPPVKRQITTVGEPHAIARATDDLGNDVTDTLRNLDGKYLDTFGRGQYQGVTRDHYVEIDLGNDLPASGPLWLIARGWLHPSDSSINIAMSQGDRVHPRPLSLEVPDGRGGWRVARPNLGFPAGRNKTCLIDLSGLFHPGQPHRLRLRTNLEIYWDQIQWAQGLPMAPIKILRLVPQSADLRYRGFSVIHQANASSPEIPDYNHLAATTQIWRDLEGFYTRYGDVRELLKAIDDRYVIMNAGDELALRFAVPPAPPTGWARDYVIVGDGWVKDGDYNSTFSRTVQPLPYHARTEYDTPPGALEDEWAYRHHPQDWQNYQTRYVSADTFRNALRNGTTQ